jgi:excisionase family DNA binding protein
VSRGPAKPVILPDDEVLLTPYEAGLYFRVNTKTIKSYVDTGKLRSTRTLGGHRRIYLSSVLEALAMHDSRRSE